VRWREWAIVRACVRGASEAKASQWEQDIHNRLQYAMRFGDEHELLKPHQAVVFVCGSRPGPGTTNSIRILPYIKKA